MAEKKDKVKGAPIEPMTAEELQSIVEGSTEAQGAATADTEVTPIAKVTYGTIKMPRALLVGTQRTTFRPNVIATGVSLVIPQGGYALIGLSKELATKTHIRLAGNYLVLPEESGKEVMVVVENQGLDAFMLLEGMPLVSYVIVNG